MSELGPETRAILLAGRDGDDPSPADRARLRRAVLSSIAAGAAGAAATAAERAAEAATTKLAEATSAAKAASAAKAGVTLSLGGVALKGIIGLAVMGAIAAGATSRAPTPPATARSSHVIEETSARVVETQRAGTNIVVEPSAAPDNDFQEKPTAADAPSPPVRRATATAATATPIRTNPETSHTPVSPPVDPLLAETQRLREAHGALQGGDPERALSLLDERNADAEGQKLHEERAAARVLALCKLGRVDEANAEAARFLEKNPRSPLAARVRKACPAGR